MVDPAKLKPANVEMSVYLCRSGQPGRKRNFAFTCTNCRLRCYLFLALATLVRLDLFLVFFLFDFGSLLRLFVLFGSLVSGVRFAVQLAPDLEALHSGSVHQA